MKKIFDTKIKGFTLVELITGAVVLIILWIMIAGIEYFLINSTISIIKKRNPDVIMSSVLDLMERNICEGASWRNDGSGATRDIDFIVPDSANPQNRALDVTKRYRCDTALGTITFFPVAGGVESDVIMNNLRSIYVSQDTDPRHIYIQLENQPPLILKYRTSGVRLSRIMNLRALR